MKPLSAIIIEMAEQVLAQPVQKVSDEAAAVSLLLAHVAWNREVRAGGPPTNEQYRFVLNELSRTNPDFAEDLKSDDLDALISKLRFYKQRCYKKDKRFIISCGTTERGAVRVAWQ